MRVVVPALIVLCVLVGIAAWLGRDTSRGTLVSAPPQEDEAASRPAFRLPRLLLPPPAIGTPAPGPRIWRGQVLDGRTGRPVVAVEVDLCGALAEGSPPCDSPLASAETDAQGRFAIELDDADDDDADDDDKDDAPPIALTLDPEGYETTLVTGAEFDAGRSPEGARIVLWPATLVEGRLVASDGHPLADTRVGWMFPGGAPATEWTTTSEEDGGFVLKGLPPGALIIYAVGADSHTALAQLELARGEKRWVDLRMEEGAPLRVSGRVVDRAGRPLAFVQVTPTLEGAPSDADAVLAMHESEGVTTSPDGSFEISRHSAGPHHLAAWAWERDTGALLAEVSATASVESTPITVTVWDPDVVVCQLLAPSGAPLAITGYSYSFHLTRQDSEGGEEMLGRGGTGTVAGDGGYPLLAFSWPRGAQSISVELLGDGHHATTTLTDARQSCLLRAP
jgi:hypothetical protein